MALSHLLSKNSFAFLKNLVSAKCVSRRLSHNNFGNEVHIPEYFIDPNESLTLKRSRLLYQSRKRGMLENGLILSTFAKKHLDKFSAEQMNVYDRLINLPSNDWDIYYWMTGLKPTPPEFDSDVLNMLKAHCQNKDKESRFHQPELFK